MHGALLLSVERSRPAQRLPCLVLGGWLSARLATETVVSARLQSRARRTWSI